MALEARFLHQMPFVGTAVQRFLLQRDAKGRSIASVVRATLDEYYDLDNGEFKDGDPRIPEYLAWVEAGSPRE